jgi:hypothetical protein
MRRTSSDMGQVGQDVQLIATHYSAPTHQSARERSAPSRWGAQMKSADHARLPNFKNFSRLQKNGSGEGRYTPNTGHSVAAQHWSRWASSVTSHCGKAANLIFVGPL